jgi:acyl carrier protein
MVSDRLKEIILDQLDLEDFEIRPDTAAREVPGWDSLMHIAIINAIENELKIKFSTLELMWLKNVGDLQKLIDKKIGHS